MNEDIRDVSKFSPSGRVLLLLGVFFFVSGCAALIYEIVWFQMLQLLIGSSAVSLAVLLGTYMGGMCLGSLLLPRIVSRNRHPIRVYAFLELGIGLIGIAILFGMPFIDRFYLAFGMKGFSGILLRGVICALCLLPPTTLMGATLPAVSRWLEMTPRGVSWIGFFYGGNTLGAVFGCLLAGFYLLRVHDITAATFTAAVLNGAIALASFGLALLIPYRKPKQSQKEKSKDRALGSRIVTIAICVSGLCALGAEVVWTRLLSLLLGGTVYSFAIILAVFLTGLGGGSHIGSVLAKKNKQPGLLFGWIQLLQAAAIAWAALMVSRVLPDLRLNQVPINPWVVFAFDLGRCFLALLPSTLLWGAAFPLALASAAGNKQDPGRLVGGIYAANTIGAILGSIGFSLLFIPWIGTHLSQRLLIGLSVASGLLLLASLSDPFRLFSKKIKFRLEFRSLLFPAAVVGVASVLALTVTKFPWERMAYGRKSANPAEKSFPLFSGEGMNSSVVVTETGSGRRNFHVSGKVVASSASQDMRLQGMLCHIPALLHPHPKSVLVVGCGAGVTAGSFMFYPSLERMVICEIEPLIPEAAALYFGRENNNVLKDPRVEVILDDARHYILRTREKFDIITSDPIHPWMKGSAALYSKEYFDLCLKRLNPGGYVTQWVPLYESTMEAVKSEVATFFDVFPHGTIWSSDYLWMGYDVVLLGQVSDLKIDVDRLQRKFEQKDYRSAVQSLDRVGFKSAVDLLLTYSGQASNLGLWLKNAEINRDRNLRLQYLAGIGLNYKDSFYIFNSMLNFFKYPEELFSATAPLEKALKKGFGLEKEQ